MKISVGLARVIDPDTPLGVLVNVAGVIGTCTAVICTRLFVLARSVVRLGIAVSQSRESGPLVQPGRLSRVDIDEVVAALTELRKQAA